MQAIGELVQSTGGYDKNTGLYAQELLIRVVLNRKEYNEFMDVVKDQPTVFTVMIQ